MDNARMARALWTIVYAVSILPLGWVVRLFSDPLRMKRRPANWIGRPSEPEGIRSAHKQW
jgi:hypothetical protein